MTAIDKGDTSWLLTSSALVMLMTPGLGFFYGGMVNRKNMLSTIAYCYIVFAVVSILWFLIGFSLVFAPTSQNQDFLGTLKYAALIGVGQEPDSFYGQTIPFILFCFFQLKFAGITPALIIGSLVERVKFTSLLIFIIIWTLIVYSPIAHWMWNENGWCYKWGVLDFAGGNVVHISSGFAGLAVAIGLGRRQTNPQIIPCNISFTLLGTALLWFGWFGFNGGSSLSANGLASIACISTNLSGAISGLTWMLWQTIFKKQSSILGFACGSVCGLVAITPGCGYVTVWSSLLIGIGSGTFSFLFCHYKKKFMHESVQDTLDVFGCHGISGLWGGFATGLFASNDINPALDGTSRDGAFYGNGTLLGKQIVSMLATAAWSFFVSLAIVIILDRTIQMQVSESIEMQGIDVGVHNEQNENFDLEALQVKIEKYLLQREQNQIINNEIKKNELLQMQTEFQMKTELQILRN